MEDETTCQFVSSHGLLKSCSYYKYNTIMTGKDNTNNILSNIQDYDTLYIPQSNINIFAKNMLPRLNKKVILITGDDDDSIPNSFKEATEIILRSPYIVHWFVQNCLMIHSKLTHMPIGMDYHTIANKQTFWGPMKTPLRQENEIKQIMKDSKPFYERPIKIYSTFHFELNRGDRREAFNQIPKDLIDYESSQIPRLESHRKQIEYAFVASPFGNGPDCHRTWEALVLGCIPIIKSSMLNPLFEELPVLLVDEWSDITEDLLKETVETFKNIKFNYDKLNLKYWVNKFNSYSSSIVIAGLAKSIAKYIPRAKEVLTRIAKRFDNYKIILVENDSNDNTRDLIKEWASQDLNVKAFFFDDLKNKLKAKHRTEVIAYCRNVCLEEVSKLDHNKYPYTLMVDMDDCLQSDKFTYEGVMSSIELLKKDDKLAVVGAVEDGGYYDIYALRNKECSYNCWKMVFANLNKMSYEEAVNKFVKAHSIDYSKETSPIEVDSAFGGAAVFNNSIWVKSKYIGIEEDGTEACEHVPMNLRLRELGYKIILNPKFILY
jgi:hypothetical protein